MDLWHFRFLFPRRHHPEGLREETQEASFAVHAAAHGQGRFRRGPSSQHRQRRTPDRRPAIADATTEPTRRCVVVVKERSQNRLLHPRLAGDVCYDDDGCVGDFGGDTDDDPRRATADARRRQSRHRHQHRRNWSLAVGLRFGVGVGGGWIGSGSSSAPGCFGRPGKQI